MHSRISRSSSIYTCSSFLSRLGFSSTSDRNCRYHFYHISRDEDFHHIVLSASEQSGYLPGPNALTLKESVTALQAVQQKQSGKPWLSIDTHSRTFRISGCQNRKYCRIFYYINLFPLRLITSILPMVCSVRRMGSFSRKNPSIPLWRLPSLFQPRIP